MFNLGHYVSRYFITRAGHTYSILGGHTLNVGRSAAARLTVTNAPIALYSLLNVAPDDGLITVRNM